MPRNSLLTVSAFAFVLAGAFVAGPTLADKGGEKGGKGGKSAQSSKNGHSGKSVNNNGDNDGKSGNGASRQSRQVDHFADNHRSAVRDYYGSQFKAGRCPPGLAKKQNGCMPPGQAKKWTMARPLGRDVIFYDVPRPLLVQLGQPPSGHRYVRVASDILMIAIGTGMVVDAIQNLGS